jgi:3-dehydroquinate dehydratase-2
MRIKIINGPNLNMLGIREPKVYGKIGFDEYLAQLRAKFESIEIEYFQSNSEGNIINAIHQSLEDSTDSIVLNAGAYTHYSIAIRDAISAIEKPVVEVHISNIFKREEFRRKSVLSAVCVGIISGFGLYSYDLAIEFLIKNRDKTKNI